MKATRVFAIVALLAACAFSASRPAPSPRVAEADTVASDPPDPLEVAAEAPALMEPDEARAPHVPTPVTQTRDIVHAASDLQKAEAEWIAAQHTFARQTELCAIDCVSRQFEAAEDEYRKARAEHERARAKAIRRSHGVVDP